MLSIVLPLLTALHLSVAPIQQPEHLIVGPQVQSSSIYSYELIQPTVPSIKVQPDNTNLQAPVTSEQTLQPAVGEGIKDYSLQ